MKGLAGTLQSFTKTCNGQIHLQRPDFRFNFTRGPLIFARGPLAILPPLAPARTIFPTHASVGNISHDIGVAVNANSSHARSSQRSFQDQTRHQPRSLHRHVLHIQKLKIAAGSSFSSVHIAVARACSERHPTYRCSAHRCLPDTHPPSSPHVPCASCVSA